MGVDRVNRKAKQEYSPSAEEAADDLFFDQEEVFGEALPEAAEQPSPSMAQFEELAERANGGDQEAIELLRKLTNNGESDAWQALGNMADLAAKFLAAKLFVGRAASAKSALQTIDRQRRDLSEQYTSRLERMMVDRFVLATQFANAIDMTLAAEGIEAITREKAVQAQIAAEKRVQAALKSLQLAYELRRAEQILPLAVVRQASSPPSHVATG